MENSSEIPIPKGSQLQQNSSNPFLEDNTNCDTDLLSSSYSEINFFAMGMGMNQKDPESPQYDKMDVEDDECSDKESTSKPRPNSLLCDKKSETKWVADNIEHLIKNSPISKFDSKNSTPSSAPFRQFQGPGTSGIPKPHVTPSIDSNVLNDLEIESQYLASNVDNLTENLTNLLHSISSITVENVDCFKSSVTKLTDAMDSNIKSMYTIIAKTEEVSKSMKSADALATRIRDIRRLVDLLESTM